jgi:hypothetical protein
MKKYIQLILVSLSLVSVVSANMSTIHKESRKKWPKDKAIQEHYVKQQRADWLSYQNMPASEWVPSSEIRKMKGWCAAKWPRDYSMQYFMLKNQVVAYKTLKKHKASAARKSAAASKWPKDYTMQVYELK